MTDRVLVLGDPRLRVVCKPIQDVADPDFRRENARLKAALDVFRAERGLGRGIAAPQIGIPGASSPSTWVRARIPPSTP